MVVVVWLVLLASTGLLINHAPGWGLDRKPLPAWLQSAVYGIESADGHYCESFPTLESDCASIFAMLDLDPGRLLLSAHSLYLVDGEGAVLEKLPVSELGLARLEAGMRDGSGLFLRDGEKVVQTDRELLEFDTLTAEEAARLSGEPWFRNSNTDKGVGWERLLLDLHAARFLGPLAVWFNDLAAGLILLLAVTGAWLARIKRKANGR